MRRVALVAGALLAVATAGSLAAATINVHVGSYYFEDSSVGDGRVVAQVRDQLRFFVDDNGGTKPHSIVVTELGIDSGPLVAGSTYVTPVLDKPGTFTLFCRVHRVSFDHFTTLIVAGEATTPRPTPPPTPKPGPTPAGSQPSTTATATHAPGATRNPGSSLAASSGPGTPPPPGTTFAPLESSPTTLGSPLPGGADPVPSPAPEGPLLPGVTGPPTLQWLRSVLVGALVLPGIALSAAGAWLLSSRRGRDAQR